MKLLGDDLSKRTYPAFVAEISCNHCGSIKNALDLVKSAHKSYADFVKIQVYTPDELTINSQKADFIVKKGLWKDCNLHELYSHAQTPPEWVKEIFEYARAYKIPLFSSVFGKYSLEVLEKNNCPAYKIASFEFNDKDLFREVANTGKPIIASTGLASLAEIEETFEEYKDYSNLMFMHCVSKYPCKLEDSSLFRIRDVQKIVGSANQVGYSDHTPGHLAPALAAVIGAKIIEKHFNDPKYGQSEDGEFSIGTKSFRRMVNHTRSQFEACLTKPMKGHEAAFQFRRSLYVVKDIPKGESFTNKNVRSIRPGYGMEPKNLGWVVGKRANKSIQSGTALTGDLIE